MATPSSSRTIGWTTRSISSRLRSRIILAHDGDLLGVLLTEDEPVGLHHQDQLGDDRRDPGEVRGAHRALEPAGGAVDADRRRKALRVHLAAAGANTAPAPASSGKRDVGRLLARIAVQVLVRTELCRVDEHADDHVLAARGARAHQRQVAVVEGAHGRHQRHSAPMCAEFAYMAAYL